MLARLGEWNSRGAEAPSAFRLALGHASSTGTESQLALLAAARRRCRSERQIANQIIKDFEAVFGATPRSTPLTTPAPKKKK